MANYIEVTSGIPRVELRAKPTGKIELAVGTMVAGKVMKQVTHSCGRVA